MPVKIKRVIIFLFLVLIVLIIYSNFSVLKNKKYITSSSELSTTTFGLVFGAGLNDDGTLGEMLSDRIKLGVELYQTGKIEKLIITGDDGRVRRNEVESMKKAALSAGVLEKDIIIDPHGYRTYESCFRAANVYGIRKVVAVSQAFHLPRIIYICRNFGIETDGISADLQKYKNQIYFSGMREIAARFKGWLQVNITKPKARDLNLN